MNTATKSGRIISEGKEVVIQNPIEQRKTGEGSPSAIVHFDLPLNKRQERLHAKLTEYDSREIVRKKDVNMRDLAALTAYTGVEYAMFTRKGERLIVRGSESMTNIDAAMALRMRDEGWRWSGHTHPGVDTFCLFPSDGDKLILREFGQEQSVIYNSVGQWQNFDGGDEDEQ